MLDVLNVPRKAQVTCCSNFILADAEQAYEKPLIVRVRHVESTTDLHPRSCMALVEGHLYCGVRNSDCARPQPLACHQLVSDGQSQRV